MTQSTITERRQDDELTRALADIAAGVVDRELRDENPFDQVDRLAELGLAALRLPADQGGRGVSLRSLFATIIDVAEADPTVAHIFRAPLLNVEDLLTVGGPVADRLLAEVASGKLIGNASSERGATAVGSADFATTITTENGKRVLNGEKFYTTGTLFSDYVSVFAGEDGRITSVVVPTDRTGVEILDDWDGFGQRRTGSGTTRFTNVEITDADVVRSTAGDAAPPRTTLAAFAQLYLHAVVAGILRAVVTDAVRLVHGRSRSFAHAENLIPAEDPSLHEVLGELSALAFVAESTVLIAAESLDNAHESVDDGVADQELVRSAALAASKAKIVLDELGTRAATLLFEAGGASAASRSKALDRHWRNIRTITLHNPARLKARAVGAHEVLGSDLPANWYF